MKVWNFTHHTGAERTNQGLENAAIACPNDDSSMYNLRITRSIGSPDLFHLRTGCIFTVKISLTTAEFNLTNQPYTSTFDEFKVSGLSPYRGFITFGVVREASDS